MSLSARAWVRTSVGCRAATSSVTWKHSRLGSSPSVDNCTRNQGTSEVSSALAREMRTNRQPGFVRSAKRAAAMITQRSISETRSLRSAAAMNSEGSTSLPERSSMRTSMSNMASPPPARLAIGCCTRRKRLSASAALRCFTQTAS